MSKNHLTQGNTAKLYCLEFIDWLAESQNQHLRILDLGCGTGSNFVKLLHKWPTIQYIGVEPSVEACKAARENLKDLNAEIHNTFAYNVDFPPVDIVISFSVFEHVYQRRRYLECVKRNLAPEGYFLINYDSGHFVMPGASWRPGSERWKNLLSPIFARFGFEKNYQSFVTEEEFKGLIKSIGLNILDDKFFNTDLKSVYKFISTNQRSEYMTRWLEFEMYLNSMGMEFNNRMASTFRSRNFFVCHIDATSNLKMNVSEWLASFS